VLAREVARQSGDAAAQRLVEQEMLS